MLDHQPRLARLNVSSHSNSKMKNGTSTWAEEKKDLTLPAVSKAVLTPYRVTWRNCKHLQGCIRMQPSHWLWLRRKAASKSRERIVVNFANHHGVDEYVC